MRKGAVYPNARTPIRERLWRKVLVDIEGPLLADDAPCWNWTGRVLPNGYGMISASEWRDGTVYVHRAAYELWYGPVPPGLQIDHLCRNRRCCNPAHLEAVTRRENMARGNISAATAIRTNFCRRGHEFTEDNTYWQPGGRSCKECQRITRRAWRARQREREGAAGD